MADEEMLVMRSLERRRRLGVVRWWWGGVWWQVGMLVLVRRRGGGRSGEVWLREGERWDLPLLLLLLLLRHGLVIKVERRVG